MRASLIPGVFSVDNDLQVGGKAIAGTHASLVPRV
jgi:hypothetical protein